ncbi:sulfite exporter TauE/SafE family protein [Allosalinactinospora lopnorensis]|uniref:sulfite exporter TauE/SafE family protein n=1 Tax=Allosalinactinospora lopnorensis TaxID=1352348 RepID=UPI000623FAC4|nr:sulfite exporter TauE/SafE family protein [Allosalinactinospora lopnorensis]
MPDLSFFLIAGLAVLAGAAVQSSVGLGLGLVAAPVISFLEPALMPGSMLIATIALPALSMVREWRHIDWHGLTWGLPGRVPGSLAGAWVVAVLGPEMLGAAVGVMVLIAVVLSLWSVRVRITPGSLMAAGTLSGVTGTATSIGGPPIALLYQHEPAPKIRGTLAGFFLFGAVISLGVLAAAGQLSAAEVQAGLLFVPVVVAGFMAGSPLRRIVDVGRMRVALVTVVTVSGLALVARSLL